MSSRRILWALLILAALPQILAATAGCSFEIGTLPLPPEPTVDNALTCECDFTTSGNTRTLRIQASSDDAEQDGASMDLTNGDLDLSQKTVGLRFAGIKIPADVTITSAYVQFTSDASQGGNASLTIEAEASSAAATFTATDNDLSGRVAGTMSVPWPTAGSIPDWNNNDAGLAQRTPDLSLLLQELVDLPLPLWSTDSAVVLRFETGTGHRTAESFDQTSARAPQLVVTYTGIVTAKLPVCALPDPPRDVLGAIEPTTQAAECARVATTLGNLNAACGLPSAPICRVIDRLDPNNEQTDDSFESAVCETPCTPDAVDPNDQTTCSKYDPVAFADCLASGMPMAVCKNLVRATNAIPDSPVCVPSGSPLAFHAFGQRSQCEVEGAAVIDIDGNGPIEDPDTEGTVEILARPCPGGNCKVHPYLDLRMDDIEFDAGLFASNPHFGDLNASARGVDTALLDSGLASFTPASVAGSLSGRRLTSTPSQGLTVDATNDEPLEIGVDFIGRTCRVDGGLALGVGNDGVCEADGTTPCASDADCVAVGGVCILPPDSAPMQADVALGGPLVNQPPTANAGADQTLECTGTAGATFTLNGNASSDPDGNLVVASWRAGSRTGPEIGNGFSAVQTIGVGGTGSYVLRVIDGFAQMDEAGTNASVVDTTAPVVACNAPATIKPPAALITFGATATDVCDDAVTAAVTSYDCFAFTKKGRRVSKLESCVVSFAGNTLSVHDVGGYGDHISWTVEAPDDSGNVGRATCEVLVAK